MKNWIRAAAISAVIIFFLSLAIPLATFLNVIHPEIKLNTTVFWIYFGILGVAVSIVLATCLLMLKK